MNNFFDLINQYNIEKGILPIDIYFTDSTKVDKNEVSDLYIHIKKHNVKLHMQGISHKQISRMFNPEYILKK